LSQPNLQNISDFLSDINKYGRDGKGTVISVQGCSFLNIARNASVRGTGIYALDSDLEIKEYCPFGCSSTSYCIRVPKQCS